MPARIAADEPALVASLTLFGAITEPPEAARAGLLGRARKARDEGMDGIRRRGRRGHPLAGHPRRQQAGGRGGSCAESLMRQNPEGYARTCEALSKARAVDPALIKAPTALIVAGDCDPLVAPLSMGQGLADKIPGATVSVMDRCGPLVLRWRKAQESWPKLAEFFSGTKDKK